MSTLLWIGGIAFVGWLVWSIISAFIWWIVAIAVILFIVWLVASPSQKRRRDRGDGFFDDWDWPDFDGPSGGFDFDGGGD